MSLKQQITLTLPQEVAELVHRKVASGEYSSEVEVILDSLSLMEERDQDLERWLIEVAAPAYDAMRADPSRGIPLEQVEAKLAAKLDRLS